MELVSGSPLSSEVVELAEESEVPDNEALLELIPVLVPGLVIVLVGPAVLSVVLEGPVSEPEPPGPTHNPPSQLSPCSHSRSTHAHPSTPGLHAFPSAGSEKHPPPLSIAEKATAQIRNADEARVITLDTTTSCSGVRSRCFCA